ncbi:MAG: hypothetical protein M3R72_05990 [Bacteroidota bacterium]|nr:hypothetical protein [Bacteroidota bacterium]
MANVIFTNKSLATMHEAAVSEKTVVEALRGGTTQIFNGMQSTMKKYGSYDLYVSTVRKSDGTVLITSVKRRSNSRNLKAW